MQGQGKSNGRTNKRQRAENQYAGNQQKGDRNDVVGGKNPPAVTRVFLAAARACDGKADPGTAESESPESNPCPIACDHLGRFRRRLALLLQRVSFLVIHVIECPSLAAILGLE
jgi:hypothetical protein